MSTYIHALLRSLCKCGHNGYSHWSQHDSACQEPGCSCKKFDREVSERLQEISAKLLRNTYCDDSRQNESGDLIGALFSETAALEERCRGLENKLSDGHVISDGFCHTCKGPHVSAQVKRIAGLEAELNLSEDQRGRLAREASTEIKAKDAEIERLRTALSDAMSFISVHGVDAVASNRKICKFCNANIAFADHGKDCLVKEAEDAVKEQK